MAKQSIDTIVTKEELKTLSETLYRKAIGLLQQAVGYKQYGGAVIREDNEEEIPIDISPQYTLEKAEASIALLHRVIYLEGKSRE